MAISDFLTSFKIAASGLHAQMARMRVASENLANTDSTGKTPGADPYRREIPTFKSVFDSELGAYQVQVGGVVPDKTAFEQRYEPGHPAADANGYVKYPNINPLVEQMDMSSAQRTYEANLNVVTATRQMLSRTIDILRG